MTHRYTDDNPTTVRHATQRCMDSAQAPPSCAMPPPHPPTPLSHTRNSPQGLHTDQVGRHLQKKIYKGLQWPEQAGHAQRKVWAPLHPYVWERTALHLPVGRDGEVRCLGALEQPPTVPAEMPRDVRFDIRAAGGITVLDYTTSKARHEVRSCRRKEVRRTGPDAWPLKDEPRRGPGPQAADGPPG